MESVPVDGYCPSGQCSSGQWTVFKWTVTVQVDSVPVDNVQVDGYCPSGQCSSGFVASSIERVAWLTASLCELTADSRVCGCVNLC